MIKAILACDSKGGVGKNGTVPWPKNVTDLNWFKQNTIGHIVVMGSATWKDPHMPRPLPRRINFIVSSIPEIDNNVSRISGDLVTEIKKIEKLYPGLIVWIIGGPRVIEQTLSIIDEFYIGRIPGDYNCDTFLPLKKIESLFRLDFTENHTEVELQIWKKNERIS